jgi:hypothetical protein
MNYKKREYDHRELVHCIFSYIESLLININIDISIEEVFYIESKLGKCRALPFKSLDFHNISLR